MAAEEQTSSKGMTIGLALLFAVMAVSVQQSIAAFLAGALFGALIAQVMNLRGRTQSLQQQLAELQRSLSQLRAAERPAAQPVPPTAAEAPRATPGSPTQPAVEAARRDSTPAYERPMAGEAPLRQTVRPAEAFPAPAEPTIIDRAIAQFVAWLKRGNPLARAGIVILFFGAAFLAKYAAEHSLFPIELRFIALAIGAFALLIVGWRLRDTRAVYAQILQGGGIAGLYLTVFAATKLYHLLPLGLALGLMVVVALAAAILAVAQNALALAVIGTAGGFMAPILVSTGSGNHVALFTYYAILNLGVFVIAWFRTWRVLNVLGFVFTFTITGLWRAGAYQPADLHSADFFLVLFFLMYVGVSILNCLRQPPNLKGYLSGSLVFGLPVVAFGLHATLVSRIEYALAWSALALGAFYLLLGWVLFRTRRETFRLLVEAFAALGIIFASLAIPLAFDTRTTAAMWAVEGAGLLWLGVRQQRKLARAFGTLLQLAGGVGYLLGVHALHGTHAVLNSAYLGAVMLGVSGVFSGYWLYRNRERQAAYEQGADTAFAFWGVAWWLFAGLSEIDRSLPQGTLGAALAYVAVTVAMLAWLGLRRQWPLVRYIALFLPSVAAVVALIYAATLVHPLAQWGAAGWLALFAAHFAMLRICDEDDRSALSWLHALMFWVLALLVAWETSWQVRQRTTGVWDALPWGLVPSLFCAWTARRRPVPAWPLATHVDAYRTRGAIPLAVASCLWIVIINLSSTGEAAWLPYLPLLNPLDVSVALVLVSLAIWWSALDAKQVAALHGTDFRILVAGVAALVFLWLNAALIRTLHHNWGAPITAYGIAHSTLVQASVSIFWGVLGFAAMTIAARRHWRYVWIVGAGLMVVVIAKLFLVDLSSIGTIARIASFLTVGALLLVTGYLAPLPPRDSEHANA
jgi:uncharacterized membrane protein